MPLFGAALPGRQSLHALAAELPGIGLALPAMHWRHELALDWPRSGLYVPASHWAKVWLALAAPTAAQ